MKKIAVIGTGYVGLVTGACLSDFGNNVICVDNNFEKIEMLNNNIIPIYEPGLEIVVKKNISLRRLEFTTDVKSAVQKSDILFIAVGTPELEDGSADLQYVINVAREIGENMNGYKIIVDKSTVPVGTGQKVKQIISDILKENNADYEFDVVSNPEFLREGSAVYDFTHPDRVVLGCESEKAMAIMKDVYKVLYRSETPFIETNIETAELIKYASNAFLAVKITYINEISRLCEKLNANVKDVARGIGKDGRIGSKFLHAGAGYGGSCFPKDTKAILNSAFDYGVNLSIIDAAIKANEAQKMHMVDKIEKGINGVKGKIIAVLGLAFKNNTDDCRESPSIVIILNLLKKGAKIKVFDPVAMETAKKYWLKDVDVSYCENECVAAEDSDALVIATEWNEFRNINFADLKMNDKVLFDLRNLYKRDTIETLGFKYFGVGQ